MPEPAAGACAQARVEAASDADCDRQQAKTECYRCVARSPHCSSPALSRRTRGMAACGRRPAGGRTRDRAHGRDKSLQIATPRSDLRSPRRRIIALASTGVVALLSRRQSAAVDVFRTACRCLIGSGLNVKANVPLASYFVPFHGFWLSNLDSIHTLSRLGVGAGLAAIVAATVLFHPPPAPKPGCCSRRGYNLTGNISGACPECGTPISCPLTHFRRLPL